jgi:hypothetical protein
MTRTLLKPTALIIAVACCLQTAVAADKPAFKEAKPTKEQSTFVFSLFPKSLQKNPSLAISVITEMTDEGRKLKSPTPEAPAYYYAVSAGYHQEGHGVSQDKTISEEHLEKEVKKSLADNGYLEGTKDHPATLVLFFVWGIHSKLQEDDPNTGDGGFEDIGYRNLLSRAALVGGLKFAQELQAALEEQSTDAAGDMIYSPLHRFATRDDKTRNLMEQVMDECYYVVVSAYEGASLSRGDKKLLWRTKMSTPAQGVSMAETSTALVASGSSFFGRDMPEASFVVKKISRGGKVELGELKVISMDEKPTEKEAPAAKK